MQSHILYTLVKCQDSMKVWKKWCPSWTTSFVLLGSWSWMTGHHWNSNSRSPNDGAKTFLLCHSKAPEHHDLNISSCMFAVSLQCCLELTKHQSVCLSIPLCVSLYAQVSLSEREYTNSVSFVVLFCLVKRDIVVAQKNPLYAWSPAQFGDFFSCWHTFKQVY